MNAKTRAYTEAELDATQELAGELFDVLEGSDATDVVAFGALQNLTVYSALEIGMSRETFINNLAMCYDWHVTNDDSNAPPVGGLN